MLGMRRREPCTKRDYQDRAIREAIRRNTICVLPTGSGKTIIAAGVVEHYLDKWNADADATTIRKAIFLATTRALAEQQANVLLDEISHLKPGGGQESGYDDPLWRLDLIVGGIVGEHDVGNMRSVQRCQVAVMTPKKFEDALQFGHLRMEEVGLLVIDECHHTRQRSSYATLMKYFYQTCDEAKRPRILGLSASPVEEAATSAPNEEEFNARLQQLERDLDAAAWSERVDERLCPHALPQVQEYEPAGSGYQIEAFVLDALGQAKNELRDAERELESAEQAKELWEAWDRCVDKITEVARDLGEWAFDRAARMFMQDLSRGTKKLHWYDPRAGKSDDDDDNDDTSRRSVGGTKAHAKLIERARRKLKALLDVRQPVEPVATTSKVQKLLAYLHEKKPRKCLVFMQQRVSCRLLQELLEAELKTWSVDWVCRAGPVGISRGHGTFVYGENRFEDTVARFRVDLRLLVSTAVLEVPLHGAHRCYPTTSRTFATSPPPRRRLALSLRLLLLCADPSLAGSTHRLCRRASTCRIAIASSTSTGRRPLGLCSSAVEGRGPRMRPTSTWSDRTTRPCASTMCTCASGTKSQWRCSQMVASGSARRLSKARPKPGRRCIPTA